MTTVPVALGERSYDVVIEPGLLDRAGDRLAPLARGRLAALAWRAPRAGWVPRALGAHR